MPSVVRRVWTGRGPTGRRVRKVAYGYSLAVGGKVERRYDSSWTREDAQAELFKRLQERDAPGTPATATLTLGEAVERYLAAKARKRSARGDALLLGKLRDALGAGTPLAAVSASKISAWKGQRLAATNPRSSEPYAPGTVNRYLAALRCLLRLARDEWEVVATVPMIKLEREPTGRVRYLTDAERAALLAACAESRNPELRAFVLFLLETGARRGEALSLTWERGVDLARGLVTFHGTKSGLSRSVPMTEKLYAALSAMPQRSGRVFRTRSFRTAFEAAVRRAGLADFRAHDCRHDYASRLVMRGATLQAVKELLGHSSISVTMRYAHLSPAHLRGAVALLDGPTLSDVAGAHQVITGDTMSSRPPASA